MIRPALLAILGLATVAAVGLRAEEPFVLTVLDESTGRGVPMVTLETVNGIKLVTDSAGRAAFLEPGLMHRRVHFRVSSPGYSFPKDLQGVPGGTFETKPGGNAEISLVRVSIAERLYRLTGQGLYRDSTLLGKEVLLPNPNLSGGFLGGTDTQVALYQGRLVWLWNEPQRSSHPLAPKRGAVATSELPSGSGLDPTQGVHFSVITDDRGDPVPILADKEPGTVRFDGLVTVPDASKGEHLLAHYERLKDDGTRAEHGTAEWSPLTQRFERVTLLSEDYPWQFPRGQAFQVKDAGKDWIYFATPFAHLRVPANYDALLTPTMYEALALDEAKGEVVWQKRSAPMSPAEEDRWVDKKVLNSKEARCQITDVVTGKVIVPGSGSIHWNAHRSAWLLLCGTDDGTVYLATAKASDGPWHSAIPVAMHPGQRFTSVMQIEPFDQEQGRYLFFTGTLEPDKDSTPRYDHNALLYRVDLDDARLKP